ncbi:MAG: hypothetical protein SFU83_02915 [Meiothermus sp.]|nr:hypothetical protein [Meiothermus sp.]
MKHFCLFLLLLLPSCLSLIASSPTNTGPRTFYVTSNGSDNNDGLAPERPWKTIAKVNLMTFQPGDRVQLEGILTDAILGNPGYGTPQQPIIITGPSSGRARLLGIELSNAKHVIFRNLEITNPALYAKGVRTTPNGQNPVQHILFENLYLHDLREGVVISGATHSDITFKDTIIEATRTDGVLLNDAAGDRFSFIGGAIKNTGNVPPGWSVHGVYASGGHGHLFDGVQFFDNKNGWSISMRRGHITIRNCRFQNAYMINNNNEDEGSTNPYTGSPSKNLSYLIYRNVFTGPGTALFQSNNNDQGIDDPGNRWVVFNNMFMNTSIEFTHDLSKFYSIYVRNNLFSNSSVLINKTINPGREHVFSHNGWWNSLPEIGSENLKADPVLNNQGQVTSEAYRNRGTKLIAPGLSLETPSDFLGSAPDIGHSER